MNVQTPTGTVHTARQAVVHGREMAIPACLAVNGFTGLRAAWATEEAVTCKRCQGGSRVAMTPEERKARTAELRAEAKERTARYEQERAAHRVVVLGERVAFLTSVLATCADPDGCREDLREAVADLAALLA
jgi:hypothetical protein